MKKFTKVGSNYWALDEITFVGALQYERGGFLTFEVSAGPSTAKIRCDNLQEAHDEQQKLLKMLGYVP